MFDGENPYEVCGFEIKRGRERERKRRGRVIYVILRVSQSVLDLVWVFSYNITSYKNKSTEILYRSFLGEFEITSRCLIISRDPA